MKKRTKLFVSAAALFAAAGAVQAQPLRMDFDVGVVSPGLYSYSFTITVDTTTASWNPGMGWSWLNFGSGRRSSFLPTSPNFAMTSPFPVGPWTTLTSVGGSNNGPMFGPASPTTYWIPTAVGESISWTGTSSVYVDAPEMRWSTVLQTGGATVVSFPAANRVSTGPLGSCCLADASCILVSSTSCSNAGGVYGGDGTTCATATCTPPTGACCRQSGCVVTNAVVCGRTGGTYAGDGVTCGSAGCAPVAAFSLTPPPFTANSRVWTYAPSHSTTISGAGFRATGFRLAGYAARAIENQQSDLLVEIVAPNGTTLLLGGDNTSPLVPNSIRWSSIRRTGTGPTTNNSAASFDGTYSWDFGPADGTWTVNFWNNFAHTSSPNVPPRINWDNVVVTLQDAGAGACCLPNGTCVDTAIGNCTMQNGIYRGDNIACGAASCSPYLPTVPVGATPTSLTNAGAGSFFDLHAGRSLAIPKIDYISTSTAGTPTTVEVWTRPGSYRGFDGDPNGWTLHETINSTSAGATPVTLNLTTPLAITGGQTLGLYLIGQAGGLRYHTSGTSQLDTNLFMFSHLTRTTPFSGTVGTSRTFAGRVYYTPTCLSGNCPYMLFTHPGNSSVNTANNGIFFDLTATNRVEITGLDHFSGGAVGTNVTYAVYYKQGTYVGFDNNAAAWTLLGNFSGTSGANEAPVVLDFASQSPPISPIVLNPGEIMGFYIVGTTNGYRFRDSTFANPVGDENLTITSNHARSAPFAGTLSTSRRFAGRVHYNAGSGPAPCYANCDGSTVAPILNVGDFTCFLQRFAAGDSYANCDGSTIPPVLNVGDFTCFLQRFAAGCP
jgi:hypothetical protein